MWSREPVDIGQEIDSAEGLHYTLIVWQIIGIYPTKNYRRLYYVYAVVVNIIFATCFSLSLLANLFFVADVKELVVNLSMSVTITVSSTKALTIWLCRDGLLNSRTYLKRLDERCKHHKEDRKHILDGIRLSRMLLLGFIYQFSFTASCFVVIAAVNHIEVLNGWFPQFFNDAESNYYASVIYQNLGMAFVVFQNGNNDSYPLCFIVLMIAHLRALAARIERVGKDNGKNVDENFKDLLACINDHKNLLNYFDSIRPAISYTLFMQFIVTGFVLCLTAIKMFIFGRSSGEALVNFAYLIAVLIEVFPCCWFATVLMYESERLTTAIYNCNWYEQDQRFRKILIIFMQRTQRINGIMAAKLIPSNLTTFIAIMRFSFSAYTILSKMRV